MRAVVIIAVIRIVDLEFDGIRRGAGGVWRESSAISFIDFLCRGEERGAVSTDGPCLQIGQRFFIRSVGDIVHGN